MKTRTAIGSIALATVAATTACSTPGSVVCEAVHRAWGDGMPDLEMHVGDTARSDLRDHYRPLYCMETPWTQSWSLWELRSSDSAAVAVSVSAEHVLETIALEVADSVLVHVHVAYHPPHEDFYEFAVRVRAP